ncbi:unnamed protein product [Schistosoma curassoni]|uniref:DDE_Tnp_1_7 domain-containing protein n=1 Tax=Schistosoma curassoni TaxID=6186 RepID=A0A183K1I4_9TREM|nr:unnamed protein product [Schistosoma curassoni]
MSEVQTNCQPTPKSESPIQTSKPFDCTELKLGELLQPSSKISCYNSNTSNHHIGIAIDHVMELLDIHSDLDAFEDYLESFEIWPMTKEDDEDVNSVTHFLTFIVKEAYSLLKTLALPEKPISLSYITLKELLLDYVKYINFECGKGGRSSKMIHEDIKSSTALRHPNPVHTQCYADNSLRSCDALHEDGHKFDSNQSIYQNSQIIVPDMVFPNDSHISDEIPCESEESMLSEHNYDRKPDWEAQVLNELGFDNDSDDFTSTPVYSYHEVTSNVYPSQYEKYVLNEAS